MIEAAMLLVLTVNIGAKTGSAICRSAPVR
jgi:hypothetical protein